MAAPDVVTPVASTEPSQQIAVGDSNNDAARNVEPIAPQPRPVFPATTPEVCEIPQSLGQSENEQEEPKSRPSGNFITKYREYADIVEAPADAHEAVAMSIVAAILNSNGVAIQHGPIRVPLDLWIILISESGAGRNTLMSLASTILKNAGLENLIRTETWGSEVALYQNLAENPSGLYFWPELSFVLKKLAERSFCGAKVWLTDRYDNYDIPARIAYRKTKKKGTPPIEFSEAPRLNIIASSSEDWLMTNLVQEDTTGGFLPRFLLIKLHGIEKDIPIPRETNRRLVHELADLLGQISSIRGTVHFSQDVRALYERWYRETKKRFLSQPNPGLAKPFFNRLRNQVLKLAVIHEVAETLTLNVSVASMKKAIETAAKIEKHVFALLPTGMTSEGSALLKLEQRIKEGKVDGVALSTVTKAFQSIPNWLRTQRIQTLSQGGDISTFRRDTGGRKAIIYVHKNYVEDHKHKFPDDKILEP